LSDKKLSILIVDDNEENREILDRRLARLGYLTHAVGEGRSALSALSNGHYDLVLLDIDMPIMDGMQTLKKIKADETLSSLPVIMLTAMEEKDIVLECMRSGACGYLTKPCDIKAVEQRIKSCTKAVEINV